jgi:glucose-6-phosphate dehydrogenase assembly protein OpcA
VAAAVSEDVWSAQDTDPDAIEAALRELLRARHAANPSLAPARVLNLVVIVDREWKGEIANRLERVGRYHASRTVLCAVEERRTTLDAVVVMSYVEPQDGMLGVIHEQVEIDIGPEHLENLDTVVDPVVVAEMPTLLWSPHGHEEAVQALMHMTDVMLIDSDDVPNASAGLARAEEMLESAYVVDLAWLRTTPWRERLAASFDPVDGRRALAQISRVTVRHQASSQASATLLAGWLASRLGWEPQCLEPVDGDGRRSAVADRDGDKVEVDLAHIEQGVPGLAGITVDYGEGESISLDRGRGGLHAKAVAADGATHEWQVLGASRGEGGILGEGVRQALLRDPTYGPALDAARRFCP